MVVEGSLTSTTANVGISTLVSPEIDFVLLDKMSHHQLMTALFVYVAYGIYVLQLHHKLTLLKENKLVHGHTLASLILKGGVKLIL